MTKDRRLGKGLAALLGTPLEEDQVVDGQASPTQPTKTPNNQLSQGTQPSQGSVSGPATVTIPERGEQQKAVRSVPLSQREGALRELPVELIDSNPFQPRRQFNEEEIASLAESIREHKQLQPILVRQAGDRYQLISGERRLRATIHAGIKSIRAEVRDADDRLVAELAIVENLQRKDLDAIEKALSFRRYIDQHQCTQDELANRLKIDRSTIANLMRLLELPEQIQDGIQKQKLSAGHARALLPLAEEEQQIDFARQIALNGWSVRETERRVTEQLEQEDGVRAIGTASGRGRKRVSPQVAALEQRMRLAFGTKTEIKQNDKGRGKITISFSNADEFDRICQLICPQINQDAA